MKLCKRKVSTLKDRTYEDIYGIEKAMSLKALRSVSRKGISYDVLYGVEKAGRLKDTHSKALKGRSAPWMHKRKGKSTLLKNKTYEEIYGVKKALELKAEQRRARKGINAPNYKDGRTPLRELIWRLPESKAWQLAVFKRDNYTCQECYQNWGKREAHHNNKTFSILLSEFLNVYNQYNLTGDKEILVRLAVLWKPFWDVDNGVTLCVKCHRSIKIPIKGGDR